ncbi:putative lysophospholipase [Leptospira broomii serovar Hurstbridge str. 5399]|uniref:Lysophospholipase n=2 Tax=Leptospira broomii TaxID=301541 RepID=T0F7Q1_9LEPT|nr:putative lysophospholipase [Leptospira broomii serovar Hurstbridge str. 5399]
MRIFTANSFETRGNMNLNTIVRHPTKKSKHRIPLVFVHGAWHGAWCWDEFFLPYFASKGFEANAFDLRGHGESDGKKEIRFHRISNYVSDLEDVISKLSTPPILIGHSMGGLVVQKYLEKHSTPGAVLLASVPPTGVLATTLRIARKHPLVFLKTTLTWSLYNVVSTPDLCQEAFFSSEIKKNALQKYFQNMQEESFLGFLDMMIFELPKPERVMTPILVLGAEKDAIFSPSQVLATGKSYRTQAEIFPNMTHDMMLDVGWEKVANRILTWLNELGV